MGDRENSRLQTKQTAFNSKTFSRSRETYMHDIFVNGQGTGAGVPPYYHVFINVNTRKAYAYPLETKTTDDVIGTLKRFLGSVAGCVRKLISDAEPAFESDAFVDVCKKKNIDMQVNDEQNHKTLGIIDRFVRTIRDMHGTNKPINTNRMRQIIDKYNDTVHSATGMKPGEMTKDDEVAYIVDMIREQESVERRPDYPLKEGDIVRLIKRDNRFVKKRRTITKHYYIVDSIDRNRIVIMAQDGSTRTVSRSDCVKISKDTKLSIAKSLNNDSHGEVVGIVDYNPRTRKYRVEFKTIGGGKKYDSITVNKMREQFPTRVTDLEFEYWAGKARMGVEQSSAKRRTS